MMAHYAFLNENNTVTEVIVGRNENEIIDGISDWESYYGELRGQTCKRTSYNAINGKYRDTDTNEITNHPGFRKNYAGIGYIYDADRDAFIPPKPFNSWNLNETTCNWEAPIPMPDDEKIYYWNEDNLNWEILDGN